MSRTLVPFTAVDRLDALLAGAGGEPDDTLLDPVAWAEIAAGHAGWAWARDRHGLDDLELDVLLLALAPETSTDHARRLGLLQADVAACRPSVGLLVELLGPAVRARFRADAPLLAERLVRLTPDPRLVAPPLSAHLVVLDDQVVDVLLGLGGLDRTLAALARLTAPPPGTWDAVPLPPAERERLLHAARAAAGRRPWRLHLAGPRGSGRAAAAAALAGELHRPLLDVDLPAAAGDPDVLARAVREAELHGAVLHLRAADELAADTDAAAALCARLARYEGVTVLSGTRPWCATDGALSGVVDVALGRPAFPERRELWRRRLLATGADPALADDLAARFHGGPGPIADAVAAAAAGGSAPPERAALFAAARGRGARHLSGLARRVEPAASWDGLVLPPESLRRLRELCRRVELGPTVWEDWGFARTVSRGGGEGAARGRGVTALFAGPPGTGKTMAAEVVAREIGLDLYAVDLAGVISKYIGETEKNLDRIFTAAAEADAVLLFDEADALFGKRSEVRDAHDRYANVETAFLLQRMELHPGVAVLATNLRAHLDAAFTRRLQFVVDFPFPDDVHRRRLWEVMLPAAAPRDTDLDLDALARDVRLAGGNIRNVTLHAAFLAAADGRPIGAAHVRQAVADEYHKLGRAPEPESGG